MKASWTLAAAAVIGASAALAKLPAPGDEATAKGAEAAAKTTWSNQVANYQLCKAMDHVAANFQKDAKKAGKGLKAPVATPPCADPGPFVYVPPATASAASAAPAMAAAMPAPKK